MKYNNFLHKRLKLGEMLHSVQQFSLLGRFQEEMLYFVQDFHIFNVEGPEAWLIVRD